MKSKIVLKDNGIFFNVFGGALFLYALLSTFNAASDIGFQLESMLANVALQVIFALLLPAILITAWFMNFVNENDSRTFKMVILIIKMTCMFPVIHFINIFVDLLKMENVAMIIYFSEAILSVFLIRKISNKMKALEEE